MPVPDEAVGAASSVRPAPPSCTWSAGQDGPDPGDNAVSTSLDAPSQNQSAPSQNQSAITDEEIFAAHEGGKLSVAVERPLATKRDLSIAYTPGVAQVSRAIAADPTLARTHTWASRLVAVVSDGTAVLGLGDIGPSASLPVMEGKSALFKTFGGLDSIPIVLDTTDVDEIVETIVRIAPSFGAVNLEDVSAPRCFELEAKLIEALDMPVMHDDQHGTAVVVLAALTNAAKVVGKELAGLKAVIAGAGAAGIAIAEILLATGLTDVVLLDSKGAIHAGRPDLDQPRNSMKAEYAARTNPRGVTGGTAEALAGADVFIGVSSSTVPEEHLAGMTDGAIVFALSNPDPEVAPDVARRHAAVVATGRSDFPNQINNVLAFPGIFRGALDAGARRITPAMKIAAARAIAELAEDKLSAAYIVPSPLDPRVAPAVTAAVIRAAGS
jgi:malate dehydrogenase (oxaloacetate-decarboxylating)